MKTNVNEIEVTDWSVSEVIESLPEVYQIIAVEGNRVFARTEEYE